MRCAASHRPRTPSPRPAAAPPRTATRSPTTAAPPSTSATWPASSPSVPCAAPPSARWPRRSDDMQVSLTVNGEPVSADVEPRMLLVHFLRDTLRLTGTHWGCDTSNCGVCVVQVDGEPVKSCTMLAAMADGHEGRTVGGLADGVTLDPVQEGFMAEHGLQCGFCTPGMMMSARALLDANPNPSEEEIRVAISGQLCRCTGYKNIVASIR